MIRLRFLLRFVPASAFFLAVLAPALAQTAAPAARIVARIDESQLVPLRGNTNPHANAANDRGVVSADFALPDLTLVLRRGAQQESAFEAYIESEYDSASPNYHHWLTPAQIGEQYGPAQADIATITNWLSGHGFVVQSVAPDRMTIRFSGTAGQVASAFHTEIHHLSVSGVAHIGNTSDPEIPAALAPVVAGVKSLNDFRPHPLHRQAGMAQWSSASGRWQRLATTTASAAPASTAVQSTNTAARVAASRGATSPQPQFGINVPSSSSSNAYLEEDVTPWDFATIYNVKDAWSAGYTGTGQTIAIAGTSLIAQSSVGSAAYSGSGTVRSVSGSDVATFRSTFGLPALTSFEQIDTGASGTTATECTSTSASAVCGIGDLDENSLDVEWAGAVATGSPIVLVVTGQNSAGTVDTVYDSAQYVVQNHIANILNVSYGLCELYQGTAQNVAFYNLWQSAAAEGIAVFVAAGDSGSPACDQGGDSVGWPYSAQYGLSVSGLASTPYNVAVGGTDFSWCKPVIGSNGNTTGCPSSSSSQGSNAYWSSGSTSGNSSEPYESALGYVPEVPWNDTCLNPILANYLSSVLSYFGYAGGSNPEATCNSIQNNWSSLDNTYYNNYGSDLILATYIDTVGGSGGASNCVANDGANVSSCATTAGSSTTGASNSDIPTYNDGWVKPSWQTSAEGTVGVPNDGVRDLPDVSFFAADGVLDSAYLACISADGACTYSSSSATTYEEFGGTSIASPAMAGVMALIDQKAGGTQGLPLAELYKLAGQQTYSSCSAEGPPASTCYFHSIDQGTNAMPCDLGATIGSVNYGNNGWYTQNGYAGIDSPDCTAVNSGDTVGTLTGYKAASGFTMATGLGSLNVWNVVNAWAGNTVGTASATITAQLSASTISANQSLTVAVTVAGVSGSATPSGSVVLTGGGYNSTQTLSSAGGASFTIPANSLSPGAVTLTAYYSGDATYAAQSTTATVTVSAVTPTVTIVAPASDNSGNSIPVSVTVAGPAGSSTPTGTVTLTGGSYNSTAAALSSTGIASFTIPAGDLPLGVDTLKASYSGSTSYYTSAAGTFSIDIVSASTVAPTVTVTPGATSIQSGQSLAVTIAVTGSSTVPTGYVTLTGTGGYSYGPALLSGGVYTLPTPGIPGNTFSAGSVKLTASYSGDAVYASGTGTSTVTVTQSSYALSATVPSSVSATGITPGATAALPITGSSTTDYTGTVTLSSCTLTSSPSGAVSTPTCSISGSIVFLAGVASGSGTATVTTYAATTSALARPKLPGGRNWLGAGSGAVLALLVFFGIPARRRGWRKMLSLCVVLLTLGGMVSCSSGVNSGSGGGSSTPATTAGAYTFTVQGTGSDTASTQATATFTVTVK